MSAREYEKNAINENELKVTGNKKTEENDGHCIQVFEVRSWLKGKKSGEVSTSEKCKWRNCLHKTCKL